MNQVIFSDQHSKIKQKTYKKPYLFWGCKQKQSDKCYFCRSGNTRVSVFFWIHTFCLEESFLICINEKCTKDTLSYVSWMFPNHKQTLQQLTNLHYLNTPITTRIKERVKKSPPNWIFNLWKTSWCIHGFLISKM